MALAPSHMPDGSVDLGPVRDSSELNTVVEARMLQARAIVPEKVGLQLRGVALPLHIGRCFLASSSDNEDAPKGQRWQRVFSLTVTDPADSSTISMISRLF